MSTHSKKRRKKRSAARTVGTVLTVLLAAALCVLLGVHFFSQSTREQEMQLQLERTTIYDGIYINGIHVGGLTRSQARSTVAAGGGDISGEFALAIVCGDRSWTIGPSMAVEQTDLDAVVEQAYAIGRSSADVAANYDQVQRLATEPVYLSTRSSYACGDIEPLLAEIEAELHVAAQSAVVTGFSRETGISFGEAQPGQEADIAALRSDIAARFASQSFDTPVGVSLLSVQPAQSKQELMDSYGLIAAFTSVTTKNSARNQNIKLALAALDGTVIAPGEEFSFNTATGERTPDKGYQEAGAYVNGQLVQETGGGVCQVSTSIFNAAVRADLTVVERNCHSRPSSYIDMGFDAMVDFPNRDLRILNDSEGSMIVSCWYEAELNTIHMELYGIPKLTPDITVTMRYEIIEVLPQPEDVVRTSDTMLLGEMEQISTGREGYRVKTYKMYMKDGSFDHEELLCSSYYPSAATVYAVGTMEPTLPSEPMLPSLPVE